MQASAQMAHSVWPHDKLSGAKSGFWAVKRLPHSTQANGSKATLNERVKTGSVMAQHGVGGGESGLGR